MKLLFTSFLVALAFASHAQTQQWGEVISTTAFSHPLVWLAS